MTTNGNNHRPRPAPTAHSAPVTGRRRTPWALVALAIIFVVVPFLSWYGTTFWRSLSDSQIDEYLNDTQKLRHVQHALEAIDRKIVKGDEGARRWYPRVVELSRDPSTDLRLAAAWVLGDDNSAEQFHSALVPLLGDAEPSVRRMAALSLSRFKDGSGRAELVEMLRDYPVRACVGGRVETVLPAGSRVSRETLIARVRGANGEVRELRAPVAGRIAKVSAPPGADLAADSELLVLAPDAENVLQSLRALFVVGGAEDLPEVEPYARGVAGMPGDVQKQAASTAGAIRRRSREAK
ncbi:MAG: HEAT repeat domain-containing protein [Acidobacteria bacterium]|nr:HEAT repeat domain-containing protein [Acidobacteriota bacterium]MCA1641523.1 HEAT repeat domain-containing protein [Acidobacteriota bacterium]